jgi:23S rRNA (adenine2503-C2)-methyltransferase
LLDGIAAKVNLIVFNPHEGTHFLPSDDETVLAFRSILVRGGRVCTIRNSRGDDENAACGQLGDVAQAPRPVPLSPPPPRFAALMEQQQAKLRQLAAASAGNAATATA